MKRRKRERSYWPALILTVVWWMLLGGVILWVDPEVIADFPLPNTYFLFFLLMFLAVFFLVSLLLGNSRRGVLAAVLMVVLGYLRIWGLWGWGPVILICGAMVAFEIYFRGRDGG